jgi:hypothetical protein
MTVEAGELAVTAYDRRRMLPPGAWLHVDADAAGTVETKEDGKTLAVWHSLAAEGESVREYTGNSKVVVKENVHNGRSMLDLGSATTLAQSGALAYYTADGAIVKGYNDVAANVVAPVMKTGFAVYDTSAGASAIFGGVVGSYPTKGFGYDRTQDTMISVGSFLTSTWAGYPAIREAVESGVSTWRRNGVSINPFVDPYLSGLECLSIRYPAGRKVVTFGVYGQSSHIRGGLKVGEILLYDQTLQMEEYLAVDAYLAKKWRGVETPGYGSAATDVAVAPGAQLTVMGEGFTATGLSGGGVLSGDVALVPGGCLTAVVSAEGCACLTVAGTLTLSGGRVAVTGDEAALLPGVYPLLSAQKIVSSGDWTMPSSRLRRYSLVVTQTDVSLRVAPHGFRLLFR